MPIYEYQCSECDVVVEHLLKYEERNLDLSCSQKTRTCECGCGDLTTCGGRVERIASVPRAVRMGKGIYESSKQEWDSKLKTQLTKRSDAYDKTDSGQEQIGKSILAAKKRGDLP